MGDECRRVGSYAYADVPLVPMPDNATLDGALRDNGWTLLDTGAYAVHDLAGGGQARLDVGIPNARVANGSGLFISAVDSLVSTEEESRAILEPVVEPLARALGSASPVYHGGVEHCGAV